MKTTKCPICDNNTKYPILDYGTGFSFCADHFTNVRDTFDNYHRAYINEKIEHDFFATWLISIADVRKTYIRDNQNT